MILERQSIQLETIAALGLLAAIPAFARPLRSEKAEERERHDALPADVAADLHRG